MDEDWYRGDGYGAAVYTVAAVLRGLSDGGASGGVGGHEDASSTRAAAAAAATSPTCITQAAAHWQMGCPPGDLGRPSARGPAGGLAPVAACGCTEDGGRWYVSTFPPLALIGGATPAPLPDILPRGRSSPDADPVRGPAQPGGGPVRRRAPNGGRYGRRGFRDRCRSPPRRHGRERRRVGDRHPQRGRCGTYRPLVGQATSPPRP